MKALIWTADAAKDLKRHSNVAARLRKAVADDAADPAAHADNVTRMVGSAASRMRVGQFRTIFVETDDTITVTCVGPRGDVYEKEADHAD